MKNVDKYYYMIFAIFTRRLLIKMLGVFLVFCTHQICAQTRTVLKLSECNNTDVKGLKSAVVHNSDNTFSATTNADGLCLLPNTLIGDTIIVSMEGYKDVKTFISTQDTLHVCLHETVTALDEVVVYDQKIDFNAMLLELKRANQAHFFTNDTMLAYTFRYWSECTDNHQIIDSATGYLGIDYKDNKYPLKMFNGKGSQFLDFSYYIDSLSATKNSNAAKIQIIDVGEMFIFYNMMDNRATSSWKNIVSRKDKVKLLQKNDTGFVLASFNENGDINKKFYFDHQRQIERIDWLIARRGFKNAELNVSVFYAKGLSKIATRIEQHISYSIDSLNYKSSVVIAIAPEYKKTLYYRRNRKSAFFPLSLICNNFYTKQQFIQNEINADYIEYNP